MAEFVTLHCELGDHDWERPKARGARPKNCPNHQPVAASPLDPEERIRRQQEGRRIKQEAKDKEGIQDVLAYRKWVKKDAAVWAAYRSGEITQQQYNDRKPRMPKVPDKPAYEAARRAGLAPAEAPAAIIEGDDED